jgi:hypothetical protein
MRGTGLTFTRPPPSASAYSIVLAASGAFPDITANSREGSLLRAADLTLRNRDGVRARLGWLQRRQDLGDGLGELGA